MELLAKDQDEGREKKDTKAKDKRRYADANLEKKSNNHRGDGKQREEPFGIKHLLIGIGCVALLAFVIQVIAYFLYAIVMVTVLLVVMQALGIDKFLGAFLHAIINSSPDALKKDLENAKASGEISEVVFGKVLGALFMLPEDSEEKQQVESMLFELLREMDPRKTMDLMKDMKMAERNILLALTSTDPQLQQLLGLQPAQSQEGIHSKSGPYLDYSLADTMTYNDARDLKCREPGPTVLPAAPPQHEDMPPRYEDLEVEERRNRKDKKKHKNPLKSMLNSVKRAN